MAKKIAAKKTAKKVAQPEGIVGEIEGDTLVLRVPLLDAPILSKSGDHEIIARGSGFHGFEKLELEYEGEPIKLFLQAMIATRNG